MVSLRLANVSLIGLDTTATQLGIGNVHLFQPPLPPLTGEVSARPKAHYVPPTGIEPAPPP